MSDATDMELVREFAERASEAAFTELVRRHVNLVYSVALRFTGNATDAEDIVQAVFIILAKKAARLRSHTVLTGWMYETTRFAALQILRTGARRHQREQEAHTQSTIENQTSDEIWRQIGPVLEQAMSHLNEKERTLIALRYFENRSSGESAALLGIGESAARKRSARALEKLRNYFSKRGLISTTTILAETISAHSVQIAPATLARFAVLGALAKGAATSGSTLTLTKGTLKLMAWSKAKTAVAVAVIILIWGGAATIVRIEKNHDARMYSWRVAKFDGVNNQFLWKAPPQVRILPTKFAEFGGSDCYDTQNADTATCMGICASADTIVDYAYLTFPPRIVFETELPTGHFDFIANLPHGSARALQEEVKKKFGLVGRTQMRETDVFVLKLSKPEIQGFKTADTLKQSLNITDPNVHQRDFHHGNEYGTEWFDQTLEQSRLRDSLEQNLKYPVVDETGLTDKYDFSFAWPAIHDNDAEAYEQSVNSALMNQLGLELVPASRSIDMLVVEKAL